MTKKIWNLKYVAGNPRISNRVIDAADNPRTRADAMVDAEAVAQNGWRVWVEHAKNGTRIFESEEEKAHTRSKL
ncbi:TPA: hypothetical protein QDC44_007481 [Burkholderia cepacia ATCC 25416]|nr:hypothetical protein [Burkholderia cepacia ATCC 25416]